MPRSLIVKLGAIGDVIMTLPAAFALHESGHEIHWICGRGVLPILELYPWVHPIPVDERALLQSGMIHRLQAMIALWRRLGFARYDTIATLYYDRRYRALTLPLRARRSILLRQGDRSFDLLPNRHHTDEYAKLLVGADAGPLPHSLAPIFPANLPPSPLPPPQGTRIVLAPAGAKNLLRDDALRRWPAENYVSFAEMALKAGYEVVLAGGPDDLWIRPCFEHLPVTDLIAQISLPQLLALFDASAAVITHDTGPLHLAGITKTKLLGIFGPISPWERLPRRPGTSAIWGGEGFSCRPCYVAGNFAACTNNLCIQQVTPAMAFRQLQTLLDHESTSPFVFVPPTPAGAFV
jgi:heptosyltransferase II